jgi:ketosteroid isomerase-like protein
VDPNTARALLDQLHDAQNEMYAGGDFAAVGELLADDVEWHVPGRNAISGVYRGIEEVLEYFRRRRELASGTLRLHRADVLVGEGDRIVALTDGTATLGGAEQRWSTVGLYRVRDGRIAACWLLPLDQEQFDRFWAGRPDKAGRADERDRADQAR